MKNFGFLSEAARFRSRISQTFDPSTASKNWLVPIQANKWDEFIESIQAPSTGDWLKTQKKGLFQVPTPFISDVTEPLKLSDESVESLLILKQDKDTEPSEGTMLPPGQLWSPVAGETSASGTYQVKLDPDDSSSDTQEDVISYLMSCYKFDYFKSDKKSNDEKKTPLTLYFGKEESMQQTLNLVEALYWTQDLISTPANFLTPGKLQSAVEEWAAKHDTVSVECVVGTDLLEYNGSLSTSHGCGMIHAVGRGAGQEPDREPRLIRLTYTPAAATTDSDKPIALVGKGVTFDTGGLNLKPGASMINMKKDMGGAAHALGLFRALVEANFPKPVHGWIPCVENSLDGVSFRPGDILTAVNGVTSYIGNTDAEGRLILADALALAGAERPEMIIDFATLTGAQRVAMGFDIPSILGNKPNVMEKIMKTAQVVRDPVWPLPLWEGYRDRMKHKIADLQNIPSEGTGGCITAALYLSEFVDKNTPWVHVDFNGLDTNTGFGKAQSLRTMYQFLRNEYG